MSTLSELRDYYDNTDCSAALVEAVPGEPVDEVLVSTSIRLTKTMMDRVRAQAEAAGMPATALMRQWIIDRLDGSRAQAVVTVADLEQLIASRARPVTG